MEAIAHRHVGTNGVDMHIAEIGTGPVVLLLHGFPEIWYSWRHQMVGLAAAGFHAIAPDFRGYGLTRNTDPSKNDYLVCVDDIVGLLDALHFDKVYVVAKDWGAFVAYPLGYMHPDHVLGLAVLGIPFSNPLLASKTRQMPPEGHYVMRFAVPGVPEADFTRFDVATVIKRIYILFCNSSMPIASENQQTLDLVNDSAPLPEWMTNDDLSVYAELYENSGFEYPMEVPYRCWTRVAEKLKQRKEFTIAAPVLVVVGDRDYVTEMKGMKEAFDSQTSLLPNVKVVHIEEGSHFVQEQFPNQINSLLIDFLTTSNK